MQIARVVHKAAQEQRGGARPRKTPPRGVIKVSDARFNDGLVGIVEGQPPDRIKADNSPRFQGCDNDGIVAILGGKVGAHGNSGGPCQGCHRQDHVRRLLLGPSQRVAQNQAALGVGVVHLDRQALA